MPKIPQVIAQEASLGRAASAADFGAGQGLQQVAGAVSEVGDVTARLFDVEMTSRVSSALSQSAMEISNLEFSEAQDPDHMGREARFKVAAQKIRERFSKSLKYPKYEAAFGSDFDSNSERSKVRLRAGARKATFDETRAVLDVSERELSRLAAQEMPGQGRDAVVGIFRKQSRGAENNGAITSQERIARDYAFDDAVLTADVRTLIRDNPEQAVKELLDPNGRISTAMAPEVASVWLDRAIRAYEVDLAEQVRADDRQDTLDKRERENAAELLQDELDGYLDTGTSEDIQKLRDRLDEPETETVLTTEQTRWYRRRLAAGGGLGEVSTNVVVYDQLSQMINRDDQQLHDAGDLEGEETLRDKVRQAYREMEISKADRDRFLKLRDDHRYGFAENYIRNSLSVSLMGAETQKLALAEGVRAFQDWKLQNPEATRLDSMDLARNVVKALSLSTEGWVSTVLQKDEEPYLIRDDNEKIDMKQVNDAVQAAVTRKQLSRPEARQIIAKVAILDTMERSRSGRNE